MRLRRYPVTCLNRTMRGGLSRNTAPKPIPSGNRREQGSVLFIVLIFVIAVTTMVLISSLQFESESRFIENETARVHAYANCVSGLEFLKNRFVTGTNNNIEFLDGMTEPHSPRLFLDGSETVMHTSHIVKGKYAVGSVFRTDPDLEFKFSLQDSSGRINVFRTERGLLKNLFTYHGIPAEQFEEVMDSLFDWMDKDDFIRPNGAESDYYIKNYGYSAANRLIDDNDELVLIKGFDRNVISRIGHLLDFSPLNQGVNPNTMKAEAFYLFNGISEEQIGRILEKRWKNQFEGPAELTLASGYNFTAFPTSMQFFTSNTTYVKIKAQMGEKRYFYIQFRLDRKSGGGSMVQVQPDSSMFARQRIYYDFNSFYHIYNWQEGTQSVTAEDED